MGVTWAHCFVLQKVAVPIVKVCFVALLMEDDPPVFCPERRVLFQHARLDLAGLVLGGKPFVDTERRFRTDHICREIVLAEVWLARPLAALADPRHEHRDVRDHLHVSVPKKRLPQAGEALTISSWQERSYCPLLPRSHLDEVVRTPPNQRLLRIVRAVRSLATRFLIVVPARSGQRFVRANEQRVTASTPPGAHDLSSVL